jgi:hypothetical protein
VEQQTTFERVRKKMSSLKQKKKVKKGIPGIPLNTISHGERVY